MPENPPESAQRIIPMLVYEDAPGALEFLCRAFGFEERFRMENPDGTIGHAEVVYARNVVMVASVYPPFKLMSPRDLPGRHSQLYCYVEDVDAHHARAKAEGAAISQEPADQGYGDRTYRAEDVEGHRWIFATHLKKDEG